MKKKHFTYFICYGFAIVSFAGIIAIFLIQTPPAGMGLYSYIPILSMWFMLGIISPILYYKGFAEGKRMAGK